MVLLEPIWLLVAIPLAAVTWYWRPPPTLLLVLRCASLVLILLAMAGLSLKLPSRAGVVVVVADRSDSMPVGSAEQQIAAIDLVAQRMGEGDRLAVVAFGHKAAVEQTPDALRGGKFGGFVAEVESDASNLADALDLALTQIPHQSPGRIMVISDGRYTGRSPFAAVNHAGARGIAIDYRLSQRAAANDVAIDRVSAPSRVFPAESFVITAWIRCPTPQRVHIELRRGDVAIASGEQDMPSGLSRLLFRDTAHADTGGTMRYTLHIRPAGDDPVPENNTARLLVGVEGQRSILHVVDGDARGLPMLLRAGGLPVESRRAADIDWSLDALANHSAVIIENVRADAIGESAMRMLAAYVSESGAGLMMTGGRQAYGPGGYFRSPLEPILPVSMELRKEHRKLAMAIVVVLDRSGSMMAGVGGGKTKMDLANLGTAEVLDLMSPMDQIGVLAVDTSPHVIVPLQLAENKGALRGRILGIQSMGGGIYVYEGLTAAARMLADSKLGTRHIILFSDAADSEEPGNYVELLRKCREAGITVSVIGLGTPADVDAKLLEDIAARGGGRIFFTDKAQELPRLFAQDTFSVARSTFIQDPIDIKPTAGLLQIAGRTYDALPALGGYNLCYLRPGANLAAVTQDEYAAPVVASWQAGIGRVLTYAGEADGEYTGEIARWEDAGQLFTSLARWTAGDRDALPDGMLLTQDLHQGVLRVQLHLDPERDFPTIGRAPTVSVLRGKPGRDPHVELVPMRFHAVDTLMAELPLRSEEVALPTVRFDDARSITMSPVVLPYSPEFEPPRSRDIGSGGTGAETLARLARATGGVERVEPASIWSDLIRRPRYVGIGHWLLIAAAVVLLIEVMERRTGALSMIGGARTSADTDATEGGGTRRRLRRRVEATRTPAAGNQRSAPESVPDAPQCDTLLGALREARRRSGK
jgi:Mg-chelatase subunit ChlD